VLVPDDVLEVDSVSNNQAYTEQLWNQSPFGKWQQAVLIDKKPKRKTRAV
jgi:hypothetical protein